MVRLVQVVHNCDLPVARESPPPLALRAEVRRAPTERHALHRGAAAVAGLPRATIGVQRVREVPRLEQLLTFMSVGGEEWRLAGYRQFAHRSYRCRVESMR